MVLFLAGLGFLIQIQLCRRSHQPNQPSLKTTDQTGNNQPSSRPSIVSAAEFETDKDSLRRMLQDFSQDRPHFARAAAATAAAATAAAATSGSPSPPAAAASGPTGPPTGSSSGSSSSGPDGVGGGMAAVMSCYESELRSPIRNLVAGDLARTLLIQVGAAGGPAGPVCQEGVHPTSSPPPPPLHPPTPTPHHPPPSHTHPHPHQIQRLKVDTEAAMLELDQILKSNELTVTLLAGAGGGGGDLRG